MEKIRLKLLKGLETVAEGELMLYPDRMPIADRKDLSTEDQQKQSVNALLSQLLKAEQSINTDGPLRAHFEVAE